MTDPRRTSTMVTGKDVAIETYIDGQGPCVVILPSYGRDGSKDYDHITRQLTVNGWRVVRPQPRGIAGSTGPMNNQSLHDLAGDVALCIRALCDRPVVLLGHAFGNVLARVVTTDHSDLVKAVVLAAAEASKVPEDVAKTPFIASDPSAPDAHRLTALRQGFFAPGHDPSIWLSGWYPATLKLQHAAAQATGTRESWACGDVPVLQLLGDRDPFNPQPFWHEMQEQFGNRVTVSIVQDASHALFPEQPAAIAEAILSWIDPFKE